MINFTPKVWQRTSSRSSRPTCPLFVASPTGAARPTSRACSPAALDLERRSYVEEPGVLAEFYKATFGPAVAIDDPAFERPVFRRRRWRKLRFEYLRLLAHRPPA